MVPNFILSLLAGVWTDRYNCKRLIIVSDVCIAFIALLLAVAFMLDYDYIWLMFFVLVIRGFGSAVQLPAVNAVIPALVPKK